MRLIDWMEARDVTVDEVAAAIGKSTYRVSQLAQGRALPSVQAWRKIKDLTHGMVTADDFYAHRLEALSHQGWPTAGIKHRRLPRATTRGDRP